MAIDRLGEVYTRAIHENFPLYAVWPIGMKLELGDFGRVEGDYFKVLGNIKDKLAINLSQATSSTDLVFDCKSIGISEAKLNAAATLNLGQEAGAPAAGAVGMRVSFASQESVYFRSMKLTYSSYESFSQLATAVMQAFKDRKFDGSLSIVHNLFRSEGTTVLISNGNQASIEIWGNVSGAKQIDLADASAGLSVANQTNIGLSVVAIGDLVPLFGLCSIRPKNRLANLFGYGKKELTPYLLTRAGESQPATMPGDIILKHDPDVSLEAAETLGKPVDEVFHLVEIP